MMFGFFLPLALAGFTALSFAQNPPSHAAAVLCRCTLQVTKTKEESPHSQNLTKAQEWCVNYVNTLLKAKGHTGESQLTAQASFHSFQPDQDVYVCEAKSQEHFASFGSSHEEAKKNAYQSCLTLMEQHFNVFTPDMEYQVHPPDVLLEDCHPVNPQTTMP